MYVGRGGGKMLFLKASDGKINQRECIELDHGIWKGKMGRDTYISIREAEPKDAERICACLRAAFEPYRAAYTTGAFEDTVPTTAGIVARFASMRIFVACDESDEVLGTIACGVTEGEGHLRGMAVLSRLQGRAVAARLLAAAEAALQEQECPRVTLDTTAPLVRAIGFYERHGYSRSGKVTDFYGMPLYEFAKSLRNSGA